MVGIALNGWLLVLDKNEFFDQNWLLGTFSMICEEYVGGAPERSLNILKITK